MIKNILLALALISSLNAGKMVFEITEGSSDIHMPFKYNDNGKCNQIIERKAYMSCYSYENKIPLFVSYKLTKESVSPSLKRPSRFYYDNTVPSQYRSKLSHYKRSGYDRGHMMENASADYDKQAQTETFILSNIVPQNSKLNRTSWAYLERSTRIAAKRYGEIYVVTGAIPSKNNFLKKGHVNIPSYMYKIIYIPSKDKTTVILVPNDKTVKKDEILTSKYKSSLKEIEKMTGIQFNMSEVSNPKEIKDTIVTEDKEKSYYQKLKEKASEVDYKDMYYKIKKVL